MRQFPCGWGVCVGRHSHLEGGLWVLERLWLSHRRYREVFAGSSLLVAKCLVNDGSAKMLSTSWYDLRDYAQTVPPP